MECFGEDVGVCGGDIVPEFFELNGKGVGYEFVGMRAPVVGVGGFVDGDKICSWVGKVLVWE